MTELEQRGVDVATQLVTARLNFDHDAAMAAFDQINEPGLAGAVLHALVGFTCEFVEMTADDYQPTDLGPPIEGYETRAQWLWAMLMLAKSEDDE